MKLRSVGAVVAVLAFVVSAGLVSKNWVNGDPKSIQIASESAVGRQLAGYGYKAFAQSTNGAAFTHASVIVFHCKGNPCRHNSELSDFVWVQEATQQVVEVQGKLPGKQTRCAVPAIFGDFTKLSDKSRKDILAAPVKVQQNGGLGFNFTATYLDQRWRCRLEG